MNVELKPELEKFIDDQVRAGVYPSPEAAIEAAVQQLRLDCGSDILTDEDLDAIRESDEQIGRGEYVDFDTFAAEMREKYRCE